MTVVESVRLGLKLQEARGRPTPVPWRVLSKRLGIPVRTLHHQWGLHEERRAVFSDTTGAQILRETAHLYAELLDNAFELLEGTKNPAIRTGAIRTIEKLLEARINLFNLRYDHAQITAEKKAFGEMVAAFAEVIKRPDIPTEVRTELGVILTKTEYRALAVERMSDMRG